MKPAVALRFQPGPEAPRDARRALDGLDRIAGAKVMDDIRLLVTELVTNSVRHAGLVDTQWIELRVHASPEVVRVEVTDEGPGFEVAEAQPSLYQTSGWGLYLVGQLADRWGVETGDCTRVWFEIDRSRVEQEPVSEATGPTG